MVITFSAYLSTFILWFKKNSKKGCVYQMAFEKDKKCKPYLMVKFDMITLYLNASAYKPFYTKILFQRERERRENDTMSN
jgi:hypothetical protein